MFARSDFSVSRRSVVKASLAAPALALLPAGFRGSVSAQDAIVATMVTDTAGLGDQNFNDLAFRGGTRASEELGVDFRVIESADQAAYSPNLSQAAEQGQLTVAVGFLLTDAVTEVSAQFPDKFFQLIDSVAEGDNVQSVLFREEQIGYLAGIISGLTTTTNKLGIIGGQRIPPVIRYEVGFVAGVRSVNEAAAAGIVINYTDTFSDQALGKDTAAAQYNQGCDIVFPIAGLTGTGSYLAAAELNKPGEIWVVGVDTAQDHLAPGYELCVGNKGVDFAVKEGCRQIVEGNFETGVITYDLPSGGIDLTLYEDRTPKEVNDLARGYKQAIIDGKIVPPTTDEELASFVVPERPAPIEASPEASPEGM